MNKHITRFSDLESENMKLKEDQMDNPAGIPRDVHEKMLADVGAKNQENN